MQYNHGNRYDVSCHYISSSTGICGIGLLPAWKKHNFTGPICVINLEMKRLQRVFGKLSFKITGRVFVSFFKGRIEGTPVFISCFAHHFLYPFALL